MSSNENRIVRLPEVARITGLSKPTIHRRYRNGTFPRPVKLGASAIGWRLHEIEEWIAALPTVGGPEAEPAAA